ncbi:glycosyltransferase family 9 protein [Hwanghaeella sp. 1Z406]|jgi:heptosyltransferase III|uniref:glycosyltransferase family 9 protein n=1 Tax=Hwanghaeella sp. 1Z406 TaxID=3402811 RepID=UPI002689F57A
MTGSVGKRRQGGYRVLPTPDPDTGKACYSSMRLLFITSNRIGDAVLSTGLLSHLIDRDPGIRVTIAAGPASAPLFEAVPGLERLIVLNKARFHGHWWRLWRAVGLRKWDVAVDLRRSAILNALRAEEKLRVPKPVQPIHRVDVLGSMVGRADNPPLPKMWWSPDHEERAAAKIGSGNGKILAIGPTANWQGKIWPADRFVSLIDALTGPSGPLPRAKVAVFGGPGERQQAMPVLQSVPEDRRIDLVGTVDLLTAAAAMSRMALYVGNDSGLMHMSAAVGTPTLGLFGPSQEALYAPRGPRAAFLRTPETMAELIGFSGYDRHTVGSLMGSLSTDQVIAGATDLLG